MAQIIFIHTREDRTVADFILRAFARTNVKPNVLECSDETIFFEPSKNFEQTINNADAVFILLTTAMANNKFLRNQLESVCKYTVTGKDVWIFEPVTEFGLITAKLQNFKHYARFEIHDGWADYVEELIKFYDDASIVPLLAAGAGGGALIAEKDKITGSIVGLVFGLGAWLLNRSNRAEFGWEVVCRHCTRLFRLHLTMGEREFRCVFCGAFYLQKDSPAFDRLTRWGKIENNRLANITETASTNLLMTEQIKSPKAFISYSWDSDEHRDWVRAMATRLRGEGIDVMLDQWHLVLGDPLPEFMERAVRENDFVLLICTPNFKSRADDRKGGVGYEGNIMTGELFLKYNHRKFIPILRHDSWIEAAPDWLSAKRYIDLTDRRFEANFEDLVRTLHGESPELPPLGTRRNKSDSESLTQNSTASKADELKAVDPKKGISDITAEVHAPGWSPIKITRIVAEEITKPKMDGTRGSGLYAVPFQLSARPPKEWTQLFVQTWNSPPSFTTMHRPGIAKVSGGKIVLDGTTIEEVEKYHRETLLGVLEQVNHQYGEYRAQTERKAESKRKNENRHDETVDDVLKRIKFD